MYIFFLINKTLFLKLQSLHCVYQLEKTCYIIGIFPSSFTFLIGSSHTNFEDKDENPTLASLTIFPTVPHFSGNILV